MCECGGLIGIFVVFFIIGLVLVLLIFMILMLFFGWCMMFIIMGLFGIVVLVGWYLFYWNCNEVQLMFFEVFYFVDDYDQDFNVNVKLSWVEWKSLFIYCIIWGMLFGFMGVIYMVWLYFIWLFVYFEYECYFFIVCIGWVVVIFYIFGMLGMFFFGYIVDGLMKCGMFVICSCKWLICVGFIGVGVFIILVVYMFSIIMVIVYILLVMVFVNMVFGGVWVLVLVVILCCLVVLLGSMQNFGGYFGGLLVLVIMGVVVDQMYFFVNVLLISVVVVFVVVLVYMFVVDKLIEVYVV